MLTLRASLFWGVDSAPSAPPPGSRCVGGGVAADLSHGAGPLDRDRTDVTEFTGGVANVVGDPSVQLGGGVNLRGDALYLSVQLQREETFIITVIIFLTIRCVYYTTREISSANIAFGSANIQRCYTGQQLM